MAERRGQKTSETLKTSIKGKLEEVTEEDLAKDSANA
jgi:hypothetical protein